MIFSDIILNFTRSIMIKFGDLLNFDQSFAFVSWTTYNFLFIHLLCSPHLIHIHFSKHKKISRKELFKIEFDETYFPSEALESEKVFQQ